MKPRVGEMVVLTAIPRGMLDDLPEEDQEAIKEIIGKPVLLNEYDDAGRAELAFKDRDGQPHFLFVAPEFISAAVTSTQVELRSVIEAEIRSAFRGVTLGQGISLGKAQLAEGQTVESSAHEEITDDWSRVPHGELERDCVAHLDALGLRYYIPALMLSVLGHYDPSSMRVIGTLASLYPKRDNSWEYHMHRYSLLDANQKAAIARFLAELPKLVELDSEGQKTIERALRNYWSEYLQTNATGQ